MARAAFAQDDAPAAESAASNQAPVIQPELAPRAVRERTRVVLLMNDLDARWAARARGQLSDLAVEVLEEDGANDRDLDAQRRHARQLARRLGAEVVAWLASPAPAQPASLGADAQSEVRIWLGPSERLYRHRLGRPWMDLDADDRSAALEIAALVLRSAVRSTATPASPRAERSSRAESEQPAPWTGRVGVGVAWLFDGQTELGMMGAGAELGLGWQRWTLSVGGSFGLEATAVAAGAELLLSRHSGFAQATYTLADNGSLSCSALSRAGLSLHRRETRAAAPNALSVAPRTLRSALLAAGARGTWQLTPSQALTLTLVATWLLQPPRYVIEIVESDQAFEYPLWTVSPSLELGWGMAL